VRGKFAATFTLLETEGTCEGAKGESHDPLEFDGEGRFVSPVGNLATCATRQDDCQLTVRCASPAMRDAKAELERMREQVQNVE
jgi:hypothetical protein